MAKDTTTVEVRVETYKRLNGRKGPGESFDDVISRLVERELTVDESRDLQHILLFENMDVEEVAGINVARGRYEELRRKVAEATGYDLWEDYSEVWGLPDEPPDVHGEPSPSRSSGAEAGAEAAVSGAVGVADLDVPGQGEIVERRREVVRSLVERIEAEGRVSKRELIELVDPEVVGYADAESFWQNCGQPSLSALDSVAATGTSGHWVPA